MRRRLVVMRHATSAWTTGAQTDHERPLTPQGREEPMRVLTQLLERGWAPEIVVSSDARRTRETWAQMAAGLDAVAVHFRSDLYHAGRAAFERAVGDLDAGTGTALILGHNPGWESIVSEYGGVEVRLGPGHAALLEGSGERWWDAVAGDWTLVELVSPWGAHSP